jgi:hypothetical protein
MRIPDELLALERCVFCFCLLKRDFVCVHDCEDCEQYND